MKNPAKLIGAFLVLSSIIALGLNIMSTIYSKKRIADNIQAIPKFSFSLTGLKEFTDTDFTYSSVLINYFSPDCDHCQYMAAEITNHISNFSGVDILMVTSADSIVTNKFITDYSLIQYTNIKVLRDTKTEFRNLFGTTIVPSFFIYKNRKLTAKIIGETKIENLVNATREQATP